MKKVITIILIIIFIFVVAIGALAIKDIIEENKLRDESETLLELTNAEEYDDNKINEVLNRTVTNGNCAKVEKALKEYVKAEYEETKKIRNILENEKIYNVLTPENYKNDGPEFEESLKYIEESKNTIKEASENLIILMSEEEKLKYIEKQKFNDSTDKDYYLNFYKELINVDENINENDKLEMRKSTDEVILFLDSMKEILEFLKENKNEWNVENNELVFTSEKLSNEFNTLVDKLGEE